jgi:hypothetical protein
MIIKPCRILLLFYTFIILISCSSKKTIENIRSEIPAKNFSNYQFDVNSNLIDRVSSSNELVLNYLKNMDGDENYTYYDLSEREKALLKEYLELLPEVYQEILRKKLVGIYFVNDFLGSGLSDEMCSENGDFHYLLVFNPIIFSKTLSELVSYKVKTCFLSDSDNIKLEIDLSDEYSGLLYILLHEVTHIFDYERRITPYTESHLNELIGRKEDPSPFTDKFWIDYYQMKDVLQITYKDNLYFYTEDKNKKIPDENMLKVYRELQGTPFVSLYSYISWAEDFAEYVTFYHFTQKMNMPYRIRIFDNNTPVFEYEPFSNKMVFQRGESLDLF